MSKANETSGKSPHAFMREAFGVQTRLRGHRRALIVAAVAAEAAALGLGEGYRARDVGRYFAARAAQEQAFRPELQKWRK